MKASELYRVFRRNWPVKLVCFVLAVFIYFFYRTATLQGKNLVVPLQVSAQGTMLPTGTIPSHVKVSLKGRPQDLAQITEKNISAYVNLDYYTAAGKYTVPVEILLAPEILGISPLEVSLDRGSIEVDVAPKGRRQVPVEAEIQGTPAAGYEITDVTVVPSTVGVSGAQPMLDSMVEISTDEIVVDGKKTSFSQSVPIYHGNNLVSYDVEAVTVTVGIQPIAMSRTFADQTIYLQGVSPRLTAQPNPRSISFTLTGNQNQLEAFVPELRTVRLDCSAIQEPGTYELPVEVVLPNGMRLVSQSSRTARVSFVPVLAEVVAEPAVQDEAAVGEVSETVGDVSETVAVEDIVVDTASRDEAREDGESRGLGGDGTAEAGE